MDDYTTTRQFSELLLKFREGVMSDEEFRHFEDLLRANPQVCRYYVESSVLQSLFRGRKSASLSGSCAAAQTAWDPQLWDELAAYEKQAPALQAPEETPQRQVIQKVVYPPRERRKLTPFSIVVLLNTAAIVLFFVFLRFVPPKGEHEVATLLDQLGAQWGQADPALRPGGRLRANGQSLHLQSGIVHLRYDNGVDVLVEGPAVFEMSKSGVYVEYGRLYSRVSQTGLGFMVQTPTSRFVDLGTEFGVHAQVNGTAEVHVIKGSVQLFAGPLQKAKNSLTVSENKAVRYDAYGAKIEQIPVAKEAFVRAIDSNTNMVWRGQQRIDLADIVGGGNGLGTGKLDSGIETNTGRWFESPDPDLVQSKVTGILSGAGEYNKVSSLALIDGVFVPDSREAPVQITSVGHTFSGFVDGREVFWGNIFNGAWHASDTALKHQLKLNGQTYGTPGNPAISLHSNQGITFDLQAIRRTLPCAKILRFTSLFGVSETVALVPSFSPSADGLNSGKVNCWVLIDGKERFNRNCVSYLDGVIEIEVDIQDEDCFLTLVVTESNDRRAYDWALFARPSLLIEMAAN